MEPKDFIHTVNTDYFRLFQVPYTLTKVRGQGWLYICCLSSGGKCDSKLLMLLIWHNCKSNLFLKKKNDRPEIPFNIIMIFATIFWKWSFHVEFISLYHLSYYSLNFICISILPFEGLQWIWLLALNYRTTLTFDNRVLENWDFMSWFSLCHQWVGYWTLHKYLLNEWVDNPTLLTELII